MRIQHNIPALNAYRSYTQNVAAMKKNLEKLSSGYRINRAGDDAAGLAISEKMRAQITGLEVAQKNAKDGISLVQTAEGAMTEVHDMLNRMYELAEQSANGTYDNETDRAQMQKEIQSLSDEINRIADSSNFNGIKLVDGSLSKAGVAATSKMFSDLPGVGQTLGVDTVLHQADDPTAPTTTTFSVDFHNQKVTGKAGQEFTLQVGDTTLTGVLQRDCSTDATALTAEQIVEALADSANNTSDVKFNINGTDYDSTKLAIGGAEFEAATATSPTRITFKQTNDVQVAPEMKVQLGTQAGNTPTAIATVTPTNGQAAGATTPTVTPPSSTTVTATTNAAAPSTVVIDLAGISLDAAADKITITFGTGGSSVTVDSAAISDADKNNATAIAQAFDGATFNYGAGDTLTATVSGTTVTFTSGNNNTNVSALNSAAFAATAASATKAKVEVDFTGKTGADVIGGTVTIDDKTYEFVKTGGTATGTNIAVAVNETDAAAAIASALQGAGNATSPTNLTAVTNTGAVVKFEAGTAGAQTVTASATPVGGNATISGDYNVSTTVLQQKAEAAGERLASTYFSLTEDMVGQGNSIKIASSNYVFQTEKGNVPTAGANDVVVDVSDLDAEAADYMTKVAERLTYAAKDNAVYTVGHDGSRITVTETVAHAPDLANPNAKYPPDEYDLTTLEGIQKSLGYSTAAKAGSGGLSLQIGDTADSYNKLTVSINDCHTAAMGLADIDISTQDGASAAMKKIKSAINYVSDVRGDLGALQNRLDHTINNLSVMHENIQDAESTIRDVDIAEEMMAYTKNNILVQSSQAMLAQANQLPQGVLQLLQ